VGGDRDDGRVYTLVGASLLGFDLARRSGGAAVARVLSWALGMRPEDVPVLDALHAETAVRDAAWLRLAAGVGGAADLLTVLARTPWATVNPAEALPLLCSAPVGSFDGLLRLVRDDVFDWLAEPTTADLDECRGRGTVALVSDAIAAGYAADHLAPAERRALTAPWTAAVRRLGDRAVDLGPGGAALRELLARLARATPGDRARIGMAADPVQRHPGPWARAMHTATWAAYLADRFRGAAAAQLAAVVAVRACGVTAEEAAAGTWNAVSAAVAALAVADLIPREQLNTLLGPVTSALRTPA
jgi:hypothetical protein